jgi:2-amino-4-hydroxy-6-hydroxymethyldihydropteridine diphosphokinase
VYLGLGSNIDAEKNLRLAVGELRRLYGELTLSPVYKSAPVGFQGPDFLNLVVALETDAAPMEVIDQIERIHGLAGRSRGPDKFSSRPLDIDLLLHGDMIEPAPPLRLPSFCGRSPTSRRISCTRSPDEQSRNTGAHSMSIASH